MDCCDAKGCWRARGGGEGCWSVGNDDFLPVCLWAEPSLAETHGARAMLHSSAVVAALKLGTSRMSAFHVGVPLHCHSLAWRGKWGWAGVMAEGMEEKEGERRETGGGERRDADVHLTFLTRHILRAHCYRRILPPLPPPPPPTPHTHCPATSQLHYSPRTTGRNMGKYLLTVFVFAHVY